MKNSHNKWLVTFFQTIIQGIDVPNNIAALKSSKKLKKEGS